MRCWLTVLLLAMSAYADAQITSTYSVSIVTDWQTVQSLGGPDATKQYITQRINVASQIYENQLGIQLVPTLWVIPTSQAEDVVSEDTAYSFLLQSVELYREGSDTQMAQGVTVLFTTRNLTDDVIGYANLNSAGYAESVGIVEMNFGENGDGYVLAHELGHTLDAVHDGVADGTCPNEDPNLYIMSAANVMYSTGQFSACSVTVIQNAIAEYQYPALTAVVKTQSTPTPPVTPTSHGGGGKINWWTIAFLAIVVVMVTFTKFNIWDLLLVVICSIFL